MGTGVQATMGGWVVAVVEVARVGGGVVMVMVFYEVIFNQNIEEFYYHSKVCTGGTDRQDLDGPAGPNRTRRRRDGDDGARCAPARCAQAGQTGRTWLDPQDPTGPGDDGTATTERRDNGTATPGRRRRDGDDGTATTGRR